MKPPMRDATKDPHVGDILQVENIVYYVIQLDQGGVQCRWEVKLAPGAVTGKKLHRRSLGKFQRTMKGATVLYTAP